MFKKIIILMAALLLVLVGISCGGDKPTEEGGIELRKPDNKENVIDNQDGMLRNDQLSQFDDTMINVRLIADSGSGAYYRAPVIITYGGTVGNRKSMAIFMEKRYGAGGVDDVGVDGNAKTDIIYMANERGGDSLDYSKDYIVGKAGESANTHGAEYSRASAVVFVNQNGTEISVVASAGTGNMGTARGNGKSEVKISRGTASGSTIGFGEWEDLKIAFTDYDGKEFAGNGDVILEYAKYKTGVNFNAFYTRWGQGKVDGDTWILPLKLMKRKNDGSLDTEDPDSQAVFVLYSRDAGKNWTFGPYIWLGKYQEANEATGLSVSGENIKLALVPRNPGSPIRIAKGELTRPVISPNEMSNFDDSYNNFEMHAPYFINTRERSAMTWNSFIVNKKLTIAILSDPADGLQEQHSMMMSRVSGSGSVAVLADGTIVTVAEEAFAENSTVGENRYNLVQRRFTRGYVEKRDRILEGEEYFNPNLEAH